MSIPNRCRGKDSAVPPPPRHRAPLVPVRVPVRVLVRVLVPVLVPVLALVLAACGGGSAQRPPAVHADFRELQAAEAVLSRGAAVADDDARACPERCGGAMDVERGRAAACDVAERTDDADADARCSSAIARARAVSARLVTACGCGAGT